MSHNESGLDPATLTTASETLEVILDPEQHGELFPYLNRLREIEPIYKTDVLWGRPGWVVSSFSAAEQVLTNKHLESDARNAEVFNIGPEGKLFFEIMKKTLLYIGSEEHLRLRRLLGQHFKARSADGQIPLIESVVNELLESVSGRYQIDMAKDLAYALPTRVICQILGVSREEEHHMHKWLNDFARRGDLSGLTPEVIRGGEEAVIGFTEFFMAKITERRKNPGDDLISQLIAARDPQGALTDDDLVPIFVLMVQAGHETTADMISLSMLALLRHPDQLQLLREEPERIDDAIEELCRYTGTNQLVQRVSNSDFELEGHTIKAGEVCGVFTGAAARDPMRFENPDELDICRENNQHYAFGHGMHVCLGQHLARVEMRAMLTGVIQRFPKLSLATDRQEFRDGFVLWGLKELRLNLY